MENPLDTTEDKARGQPNYSLNRAYISTHIQFYNLCFSAMIRFKNRFGQ